LTNNLDEELDLLKNEEKILKILKKDIKTSQINTMNTTNNNIINQNNFENDLGFDTEMIEITEHLDEFQFSDFEGKLNKIELTIPNKSPIFNKNKRYKNKDINIPSGKFGNKIEIDVTTSNKFSDKKKLLYNNSSTSGMMHTPKNKNLLNSSKKQILNTEEKRKNPEFVLSTKKLITPSNSKNTFVKLNKK